MCRKLCKATIHDVRVSKRIMFFGYFLEMATCGLLVAEVALLECEGLGEVGAEFGGVEVCYSAGDAGVYDLRLEFHGDIAEDADHGREACILAVSTLS